MMELAIRTRLPISVRPPYFHHLMWWATRNRVDPHPGNTQVRSRYLSWRSIHPEGSLLITPTFTGFPPASSVIHWMRPEQAARMASEGWITPPPSTSHHPVPIPGPPPWRG